jgi:hypothetical protein
LACDAAAAPAHGLTGHYYSNRFPWSFDLNAGVLKSFLLDYGSPTGNEKPDAVRIDSQIAFGRDKGFVRDAGKGQLIWWTPESAQSVVWKGYLRLPKAGTYYVVTASSGASAVYVNRSRVALNAEFGGSIPSPAFSYGDAALPAPHDAARGQYAVPIVAAGPRVLPIEVRYIRHDSADRARGIDLYWVAPDAKRDAAGKPIAEIIPTEALYVEAPGPIEPTLVSRAHSTISSDFLYFPHPAEANLTVRLADEKGRPVAGKRVHISGLTSYGPADIITQPDKPTDANGITTARVKGDATKHRSIFFATDITDAVDVGQTAEMTMTGEKILFLPQAWSPYYDTNFKVSPTPLRVGQPTTISVPLTNRQSVPAQLSLRLLINPQNIGLRDWTKIGESETFLLKPGETRVVEITWTPTAVSGHVCFKVEVRGKLGARTSDGRQWSLISSAHAADPQPKEAGASGELLESRQQNIGPVTSQTTKCQRYSGEITCDCDGNGQDETKKTFESCGQPGWSTSFKSRCQDWVRGTTYGYSTEIAIQRQGRAYLEALEQNCPALKCQVPYSACEDWANTQYQKCIERRKLTPLRPDCSATQIAASEKCKQKHNTCLKGIGKPSPQPLPTPTPRR